jgi:predicted double-glycine peptidase
MTANRTLLQHKYASVIEAYSMRANISLRQAMDVFYKSQTYQDMRAGVSDMHCRSDGYLAEELELEREKA